MECLLHWQLCFYDQFKSLYLIKLDLKGLIKVQMSDIICFNQYWNCFWLMMNAYRRFPKTQMSYSVYLFYLNNSDLIYNGAKQRKAPYLHIWEVGASWSLAGLLDKLLIDKIINQFSHQIPLHTSIHINPASFVSQMVSQSSSKIWWVFLLNSSRVCLCCLVLPQLVLEGRLFNLYKSQRVSITQNV